MGTRRASRRRADHILLLVAVFITNLISLACQVIWGRHLAYLFGSTATVFSTVLAVFLLGLAVGALAGGGWADRSSRPWRLLARIELFLGAYTVLSLAFFELGRWTYLAAFPSDLSPLAAALAKLAVVLVTMIAPPFAIGAAFSVAVKLYSEGLEGIGHDVSLVYGVDTLGAATGALLAGFVLVPVVGLRAATMILGAAALLLGGGLYLHAGRRARSAVGEGAKTKGKKRKAPKETRTDTERGAERGSEADSGAGSWTGTSPPVAVLLAAFFASGCAALLLETGWHRFFTLLLGTHVYATSTVLAAFLFGIGAGSLLMSRFVDKVKDPAAWVALCFGTTALGGMLVFRTEDLFTRLYFALFERLGSYLAFQLALCLGIGLVVVAATLAMGANFPLVARLVARAGKGRGVTAGRIFFVNTLGAVAGAFLSELVLLPGGGFPRLATITLVLYAAAGIVFLAATRPRRSRKHVAWAVLVVLAVGVSPAIWPFEPPFHALYYHGLRSGDLTSYLETLEHLEVIESRQGLYGQVAVARLGGDLLLKHNGKTDASTSLKDNETQLLLGHLPILFHPSPKRVLAIGLGGGFTLGALTRYAEPEEIVMVEIDPLVVAMARRHFGDALGGAFEDPRVRIVTNDGRNYVEAAGEGFDIITSEPPNIWVAGVSGLFTREFYEAASARLRRRGILCQWVPLYELERQDFRILLHTILEVFPNVAFWQIGADLAILASNEPFAPELEQVSRRLRRPAVARDFAKLGMDAADALAFLNDPVVPPHRVRAFLGEIDTVNTDDLPILEYRTARNLFTLAKGEESNEGE